VRAGGVREASWSAHVLAQRRQLPARSSAAGRPAPVGCEAGGRHEPRIVSLGTPPAWAWSAFVVCRWLLARPGSTSAGLLMWPVCGPVRRRRRRMGDRTVTTHSTRPPPRPASYREHPGGDERGQHPGPDGAHGPRPDGTHGPRLGASGDHLQHATSEADARIAASLEAALAGDVDQGDENDGAGKAS
jgi:hypothetical protein